MDHHDRNTTLLQEKGNIQAARYDENTPKPEFKSYTDDNSTSTQLKIELRVLSFSRVELWRCWVTFKTNLMCSLFSPSPRLKASS